MQTDGGQRFREGDAACKTSVRKAAFSANHTPSPPSLRHITRQFQADLVRTSATSTEKVCCSPVSDVRFPDHA